MIWMHCPCCCWICWSCCCYHIPSCPLHCCRGPSCPPLLQLMLLQGLLLQSALLQWFVLQVLCWSMLPLPLLLGARPASPAAADAAAGVAAPVSLAAGVRAAGSSAAELVIGAALSLPPAPSPAARGPTACCAALMAASHAVWVSLAAGEVAVGLDCRGLHFSWDWISYTRPILEQFPVPGDTNR